MKTVDLRKLQSNVRDFERLIGGKSQDARMFFNYIHKNQGSTSVSQSPETYFNNLKANQSTFEKLNGQSEHTRELLSYVKETLPITGGKKRKRDEDSDSESNVYRQDDFLRSDKEIEKMKDGEYDSLALNKNHIINGKRRRVQTKFYTNDIASDIKNLMIENEEEHELLNDPDFQDETESEDDISDENWEKENKEYEVRGGGRLGI